MDPQQHLEADPPQTERERAGSLGPRSLDLFHHVGAIKELGRQCWDVRARPQKTRFDSRASLFEPCKTPEHSET